MTTPARRDKDRWHQLADAIGASNLRASDKSVYRALLDRADYGTAVMQHRFTETQATIARKTSHSPRMVRYAIRHLERHGWLTANGKTGPGRPLTYSLAAGSSCDCTGRVHQPEPDTPAPQRRQPQARTAATSPPERRQPTAATPQVKPRFALGGTERERERERGSFLNSSHQLNLDRSTDPSRRQSQATAAGPMTGSRSVTGWR